MPQRPKTGDTAAARHVAFHASGSARRAHQVGCERELASHLTSQFILKVGSYWGRALIRGVQYSPSRS
jgi:hypothetical protein